MPPPADVLALLRALVENEAEFLVVGGVCAVLHGAPVATFDLDVVPERSTANVDRLLRALQGRARRPLPPRGRGTSMR